MPAFVLIAAAAAVCLVAFAASGGPDEGPPAPPRPAAELARLTAYVGTWDAEVDMMGETSRGTETCRFDLGGFWLVTDFTGEFMGAPFQGHGITGFDAAAGRFTGVWVDSMGSPLTLLEGTFSADGKTFTAHVEGPDMTGTTTRFRHQTTFAGDRRTFRVVALREGGVEEPWMEIRYQRR